MAGFQPDTALAGVFAPDPAGSHRRAVDARGGKPRSRQSPAHHGRGFGRLGPHNPTPSVSLRRLGARFIAPARHGRCRRTRPPPEQRSAGCPLTHHGCLQSLAHRRQCRRRAPATAGQGRPLGRARVLAGDCQKRLALDARLPARLGGPEARCQWPHRAHARRAARVQRHSGAHLPDQFCGYPAVPAAGLPAGLLALHPAGAQSQRTDDSGAGALLDLHPGAGGGVDCVVAVRRPGQRRPVRHRRHQRAAGPAVQPHRRHHLHGAHPAALHDFAAVQRDEKRAAHLCARRRVVGQCAVGCLCAGVCAANLSGRGGRRLAGVHPGHWLLHHAGPAGRSG